MTAQAEKGARFRALHDGEPFIIPNPWDAGSARVLEALGFRALATTSSGFAFTHGRLDGGVTLEEVAEHVRALDGASGLPVSADLENGYGPAPEDAATPSRSRAITAVSAFTPGTAKSVVLGSRDAPAPNTVACGEIALSPASNRSRRTVIRAASSVQPCRS